jgi:hypothetical protein
MSNYSSAEPEPLNPAEYEFFEHDKGCIVSSVIWRDEVAHCPKCGEPGEVYAATELTEVYDKDGLSIDIYHSAEEDRQKVMLARDGVILEFTLDEIGSLIETLKELPTINLDYYKSKVREYAGANFEFPTPRAVEEKHEPAAVGSGVTRLRFERIQKRGSEPPVAIFWSKWLDVDSGDGERSFSRESLVSRISNGKSNGQDVTEEERALELLDEAIQEWAKESWDGT